MAPDHSTRRSELEVCAPPRRARQLPGRRRQWSPERVLQAARDWAQETGAPPCAYEWDPDAARKIGREPAEGVQKWVREYPRWPSTRTATSLCGSWRGLLTEAGLPSPPPLELTLSERLEVAQRLRNHGAAVVADIIGVTADTVRTYWRAGRCPSCGGPKVTEHAKVCGTCADRTSRRTLSRKTVTTAIQDWTRETGEPPRAEEWMLGQGKWDAEYPRWPALHQVQETFTSWNAAVRAAGCTPRHQRWSRADMLQAARAWAKRHGGEAPRLEDWRQTAADGAHPSSRPVINEFDTWNDMLTEAGLPITHRTWTPPEILEALAAWVATHGRAPTMDDWRYPDPPSAYPTPGCAADHFDTWNAMLEAGGLKPNRRYWTREDILAACAEFAAQHGRPPRPEELTASNGLPSMGAVRRHVGNHEALVAELQGHA